MKELLEELQLKAKIAEQKKHLRQAKQVENLTSDVSDLYSNLEQLGVYLAGGAITSVFTNKEVNDLDLYFRDIDSLKVFILSAFGVLEDSVYLNDERFENVVDLDSHALICNGYTKKSIMFQTKATAQQIQLIHCGFFEKPEDIFDTFDYTINMGVYDYKEKMFVLHEDFLTDNSCRKLTVNPKTAFPIISQLRIDKYKQRGYSINRKEFLKLSLAVANLNLSSWKETKEAMGGMYGYTMEELFDEEKEFSFEELFSQIEDLEYKLSNHKPFEAVYDYETLIEHINDLHGRASSGERYYYYKVVNPTNDPDVFESHYKSSFKYKVGEKVKCDQKGIYLYKTLEKAKKHYDGKVVIKLQTTSGERANLTSDFGGGKHRTNDELLVVGKVEGMLPVATTPVPSFAAAPFPTTPNF
tara:strand:- start:4260 stop:5498 length:1239 start_codon:yes stop_codon:yes gene_type:complete